MIIGKGMIATALQKIDSNQVCFFASGVSYSNTDNKLEFDREKQLLETTLDKYSSSTIFIYFSSCGIAFETTPYFSHKQNIEKMVANRANKYYIFRLPQVVGRGGNRNTLFNYLINQVKKEKEIEIWKNVRRNLIDIDDIVAIVKQIISNNIEMNSIINIASPFNVSILEIIRNIEVILNIKTKYRLVEKGQSIDVDIYELSKILDIDTVFKSKDIYLQNLIKKYHKEII